MGDGESPAGPAEWAERFEAQAGACDELGSPLYGRLLRALAGDLRAEGSTWEVLRPRSGLRFGQAAPLRLLGAAHRLALAGNAPGWAALLPSCGGAVPDGDEVLRSAWSDLVAGHRDELTAGLDREVQTNEVGRAAGLALGLALASPGDGVRLVELGCSGGMNLRLDRFRIDLADFVLGDPAGAVRIAPDVRGPIGAVPALPRVGERIGLDPHPVDTSVEDGRLTLLSFIWPDQQERIARVRAALGVAATHPADLRRVEDTAEALEELLADRRPTVVQHSVVWQYIPTGQRWRITAAMEAAGERATAGTPLAWVRYEPDEWDRTRAAVWLRTWPGGADRLVAHVDYHGRWLRPAPAPPPPPSSGTGGGAC
jgi:hypothetical protein